MSVISACPDIRLLAKEDGAWLRSRAEERMDTLLARFPEIDVVYAQNDRMAGGAPGAAPMSRPIHISKYSFSSNMIFDFLIRNDS